MCTLARYCYIPKNCLKYVHVTFQNKPKPCLNPCLCLKLKMSAIIWKQTWMYHLEWPPIPSRRWSKTVTILTGRNVQPLNVYGWPRRPFFPPHAFCVWLNSVKYEGEKKKALETHSKIKKTIRPWWLTACWVVSIVYTRARVVATCSSQGIISFIKLAKKNTMK